MTYVVHPVLSLTLIIEHAFVDDVKQTYNKVDPLTNLFSNFAILCCSMNQKRGRVNMIYIIARFVFLFVLALALFYLRNF